MPVEDLLMEQAELLKCSYMCQITELEMWKLGNKPKGWILQNWVGIHLVRHRDEGFKRYTVYSQIQSAPFLQFQRAKKSDADYNCMRTRFAVESWILEKW